MTVFDHIARFWPRLIAAATALCLIVASVVVVRVVRHAQDQIAFIAAIERETGLRVRGVGVLEPAFWPSPGLRARNISLDPKGALRKAKIDALTVHLDLPQLLLGRVRVAAVTLASARFVIDQTRPISPRLRAAAARDERRLDTLRLRDVAIAFGGDADGPAPLRVVSGELHWRDADTPASFSGDVIWRDEPAQVALWAQAPVEVWNGRPSALLARVRSAPLHIDAQGEYAEGLGFRGHVDVRSEDLRMLADLGILDAPYLRDVSAVAVKAEAALTNRGLSFANASIRLDGSEFEGSFSLRHDEGRPSLSATLASRDLDVSTWAANAPELTATGPDGRPVWSHDPIDWWREATADLDLRVSATRLRLPPFEASDVALAVLMKRGRLELTISEASGYGGSARGRLRVAPANDGVEVKGALALTDIDLAQLPARAAGRRLPSGVATGQVAFEAAGATPRALAETLDGRLTAKLVKGAIAGLDLEHLVLRPTRRFPVIVRANAGRTTFDEATVSARSVAGAVILDEARLRGPAVIAVGRGGFNFAALSGSIRVEAKAAGATEATALATVLYLGGSIFDLRSLPDPLSTPPGAQPPPPGVPQLERLLGK